MTRRMGERIDDPTELDRASVSSYRLRVVQHAR
jgi:hypothetical protein